MVPRTLLIVDDTPALATRLREAVPVSHAHLAEDRDSALDLLRRHKPPVVVLPVGEPEAEALATLSRVLAEAPATKIVALTPADRRILAVRAVARGAHDVCSTPLDVEELVAAVRRAFQRADLEQEGRRLVDQDAPPPLRVLREDMERRAMLDALARAGGNLSATARLLGVSRPTLYALMKQHGVRTE
ncbi:helix-turn-helix domain-containing protein [Azospirillum doebereinerae]